MPDYETLPLTDGSRNSSAVRLQQIMAAVRCYYKEAIPLNATGSYALAPVTFGGTFLPKDVKFVLDGGTILTVATVSLGTNSPNYDNIMPATLLTGVNLLNALLWKGLSAKVTGLAQGAMVYCKVTNAATGVSPTLRVELYGSSAPDA